MTQRKKSVSDERIDNFIRENKNLNFDVRPRPNLPTYVQKGESVFIEVHDNKRLSDDMKWNILAICGDLGMSKSNKQNELLQAVIDHFSYVNGYKKSAIGLYYFKRFWEEFQNVLSVTPSYGFKLLQPNSERKRKSYVDFLTERFPTLLHELYRHAINVLGCTCKAIKLVALMNDQARVLYPDCEIRKDLGLTVFHFWAFFRKWKGKLKAEVSKPRLTPEKRKMRLKWSRTLKAKFDLDPNIIVCFIDEKWFFCTSGRKK